MILTLAHTKGGVGKSMLATQLALGWAIAGRDVLLVDADRQATSQLVVAKREEKARSPTVTCVSYVEGGLLREQVRRQAPKYDTTVIDVGGRDSTALRAALLLSDLVLVPVPARSVDIWHVDDLMGVVAEVRAVRDGLDVRAVLNFADPGSSPDNLETAAALEGHSDLTFLGVTVRRRKAFAAAMAQGLHVDELNQRDPKASFELSSLVNAIGTHAG